MNKEGQSRNREATPLRMYASSVTTKGQALMYIASCPQYLVYIPQYTSHTVVYDLSQCLT